MSDAVHVIFGTDMYTLRLTDEEYRQYKQEEQELNLKWLKITQERRGIWASNQDRYVSHLSELNELDGEVLDMRGRK